VTIEQWQALGIICGAILALAGVLLLVGKGLSMLWQWRFGNEIKASLDRLERKLDQHLKWHDDPRGRPAGGAPLQPNGPRSRRRPNE